MTIAAQCNHDWRYGLRDSENGSYRRCQKCRYVESTEPAVAPTPVEPCPDCPAYWPKGSSHYHASGVSRVPAAPAESQGVERAQPVEGPRETGCTECAWRGHAAGNICPCDCHKPEGYPCVHEYGVCAGGHEIDLSAAPVEGVGRVTDDAPARVEPPEKCRVCDRPIFYSTMVHSWVHADWLKTQDLHQAQPAKHTDDRPAETIPNLLRSIDAVMDEYRQFTSQNDPEVSTGLARLWGAKRVADLVRATPIGRAETRIEVLEAALREILGRFPSDEVIDAIMADKGPGYRFCPMEPVPRDSDVIRWRAALAAPSGKQEKI